MLPGDFSIIEAIYRTRRWLQAERSERPSGIIKRRRHSRYPANCRHSRYPACSSLPAAEIPTETERSTGTEACERCSNRAPFLNVLIDPLVNRLFSSASRVRLAAMLALALAGAALPHFSWARSPQFDSAALLTPEPTSFAQCPQFFANGAPPAITPRPQLRELCYEAFAVLHSGTTKTPVFVAQRLNRRLIEDADEKRAKRFFADARLPSGERAELDDYKNSGYSRGHMAPAGDMPTPTAMAQSFSLANMVPQNAQHNGGAWNKIEQDTRHYAKRAKGDVFVITGPVFTDAGPRIGANGVKVPTYLYKLVYDATTRRAWAHWQENREGEIASQPISYQELVKRTGVVLLPGIAAQP